MKGPVGVIAGNGKLPLLLARAIRGAGFRAVVIGHRGATRPDMKSAAHILYWVEVGELEKILEFLKREEVKRALFLGGIPKTVFFSRAKPDGRAIQVLSRLKDKKDDAILRAIAGEVEREGIRVVSPMVFLRDLMAPPGCWTERRPTEREQKDISFGWDMARKIGKLDIGQCIVVKDQMVLAVEAVEGTDNAICRGARLGRGDVTVIKICKPRQDLRLDLPVIGPQTITILAKSGASALVVEAGKTIVVDREEVIRRADRKGICLIGK